MAIARKDEILEKALSGDVTAVPRYNLRRPDGALIGENITLELANIIAQNGTPVNAAALNEMLAASGETGGTSTAYTLVQDGFYLFDGASIKIKLHATSGSGATLNINGTGAKPITLYNGASAPSGLPQGAWITLQYSEAVDSYMIVSDIESRWLTVTTSVATAANIILPTGYNIFRLRGLFAPSGSGQYEICINASISLSYSSGGANHKEFLSSNDAGYSMNTKVLTESTGAGVDLIISRTSGTKIQGSIIGSRGIGGFGAYSASKIESMSLRFDSGNIAAGAVIILEGIA